MGKVTEFLNQEIINICKRNTSKCLIELKFPDNFLSNKSNKKDEKDIKKNPMSDIYKGISFIYTEKNDIILEEIYKIIEKKEIDISEAEKLQPNTKENETLTFIINSPDYKELSQNEKELIWKYRYFFLYHRYYLKKVRKEGLTKILKSVSNWSDEGENFREIEVIGNFVEKWNENLKIEDILYLLSFKFCMNKDLSIKCYSKHMEVRKLAIKNLKKLHNISDYLIQLVQALKYENFDYHDELSLKALLIEHCKKNSTFLSELFWLINYEVQFICTESIYEIHKRIVIFYKKILDELIEIDQIEGYGKLSKQKDLMKNLDEISRNTKGSITKEKDIKKLLNENKHIKSELSKDLICPIFPDDILCGPLIEKTKVFSSAKQPTLFFFKTNNDEEKPFIYKFEDVLIQDQLILQLIILINDILKKQGFNINLTTYKVFSTNKNDGLIELVRNCEVLRKVLINHNYDITSYFNSLKLADPTIDVNSYLNNFNLSTAAYSIITYILMIGDRHFDNIMINNSNGHIFHIDFGHILGHEARIRRFNQPIRFTKEMKDCIEKSEDGYNKFLENTANIFYRIRKEIRLLTNILYLMMHSSIKQLNTDIVALLDSLYNRFLPDTSDAELKNVLTKMFENSINDRIARLTEYIHQRGQA